MKTILATLTAAALMVAPTFAHDLDDPAEELQEMAEELSEVFVEEIEDSDHEMCACDRAFYNAVVSMSKAANKFYEAVDEGEECPARLGRLLMKVQTAAQQLHYAASRTDLSSDVSESYRETLEYAKELSDAFNDYVEEVREEYEDEHEH
jgi:DNA repair ATPase RecN